MGRRFTMKDESFICTVCGNRVEKLNYTARDHCPYCLSSIHIDVFPGDRACECHGVLRPIGIENNKKGTQIVYKCEKCGEIKKNIVAQDDNMEKIIELSAKPLKY